MTRRLSRLWILAVTAAVLTPVAWLVVRAWLQSPTRGLPYHDSFAAGKADEWKAFGGTWELVDGMMRNDSDERGAKLVTGSAAWRDYSIEGDIYLLGVSGDAGFLIRSGDEEQGVNAYSGYYAGVRTIDNSIVLGRAQHSWMESTQRGLVPGGIRPFQWYHVRLIAVDCQIAVSVAAPGQSLRTAFGATNANCIRSGRAGLRSYSSGGIWRNISIRPATHADIDAILQGAGGNSGNFERSAVTTDSEQMHTRRMLEEAEERAMAVSSSTTQNIANLRFAPYAVPARTTIRGVVTLTSPGLYVQDSTGGVFVQTGESLPLKVGDEVEVTGEVHPGSFSSSLRDATVRVLWVRTPIPPLSVTASQAATGRYDSTFIEVRGRLASKEHAANNSLVLNLEDGAQSFRAIMNPGRGDALFARLSPDSSLRVRGICVTDPAMTGSMTPFVLLLRSNEDLDIIAGPPWWNTGHIIEIVVGALVLALIGVFLYHRVENWRLRAILQERERLAHEMHDTLAQSFAGIGFQIQAIRNGLNNESDDVRRQLDLASSLVRHSHQEARRSIATLRTEELETEDLLAALERCARRMVQEGNIEVQCEKLGDQRPVPLRIVDTLYRIGQEAIANAVRHAQPTLLDIRIHYSANSVLLEIADNGTGFEQNASLLGFGLRGMRRRAQAIAAAFTIHSAPGQGTRIEVDVPLPPHSSFLSWPRSLFKSFLEHSHYAR